MATKKDYKSPFNPVLVADIKQDHEDFIELNLGESILRGDFRTNKSGSLGYLVTGKAFLGKRKVQVSANVTFVGTRPPDKKAA
ncbi:hypothetical protein IIA15_00370 [candidate division TA06 bacterium]|nr:hypothetical protein [candidate division TA06 bacterium]